MKPDLVIGHDYLIQMGGAERVVACMLRRHAEAPVYTSAVKRDTLLPEFREARLKVSWMQRLPSIQRRFKFYFALYPQAFRSFGTIDAHAAWVSSSTFAKCMRFTRQTATVLYCHAPTRFLWQTDLYLNTEIPNAFANQMVRLALPALRRWDVAATQPFDAVVANSETVRQRIKAYYGRDAEVIHPPVELQRFEVNHAPPGDYYIVLSRLVAYKRIDLAVKAFSELGKPLVVVGDGPDRGRLEKMAAPNIRFTGSLRDGEVRDALRQARGLIFPGEEDFGIAPVEAQACGRPVVAYARGGALETVIEGRTGCFFHEQTPEALAAAVRRMERHPVPWNPAEIRHQVERFSEEIFHQKSQHLLARLMEHRPARQPECGAC